MDERECIVCGKRFKPRVHNELTCCLECSNVRRAENDRRTAQKIKAEKPVQYIECVICGRQFKKNGSAKTCSQECSTEHRKRRNRLYSANYNKDHIVSNLELSPKENRKFVREAELKRSNRQKYKMSLDEKSKICKEYEIDYATMQVIIDKSETKEEIMEKVYEIRKKRFLSLCSL